MDPVYLGKVYRALTLFIIDDMRPFNLVEGSGFKKFIKAIDPRLTMCDRKAIKNRYMKEIYLETK